MSSMSKTAMVSHSSDLGRTLALVTNGALALALLSQVTIPLAPVPFTLQTLGVVLLAALFGPARATAMVAEYLLLGLAGVPVFSGWHSGPGWLFGPTGGYLLGFLPAALLGGYLFSRLRARSYGMRLLGLTAAGVVTILTLYLPGWAWLTGWLQLMAGQAGTAAMRQAFAAGIAPFVLIDLVKVAVTAAALALRAPREV